MKWEILRQLALAIPGPMPYDEAHTKFRKIMQDLVYRKVIFSFEICSDTDDLTGQIIYWQLMGSHLRESMKIQLTNIDYDLISVINILEN